ncbi:MAG: OpgC domain-containing protein, partial [Acetobacteraceae bacterium]|nr:OpgC domain-containing protein [Acetobacteraceae bacterium]
MTANIWTAASRSKRDARIDVMRGVALVMIFMDHIPHNRLSYFTLHNFALCDAAEVFVLLSGISAALAYGRAIDRDGWVSGMRRIARRCWQIYVAQIGLFLATLIIGQFWNRYFHLPTVIFVAVLQKPVKGVLLSFLLAVQPDYLNILPLYIVVLALFPVMWLALRHSIVLALTGSASLWLLSTWIPEINLPNWVTHEGWYFNPFAWQFLMTIGLVLARLMVRNGGNLPWHPL